MSLCRGSIFRQGLSPQVLTRRARHDGACPRRALRPASNDSGGNAATTGLVPPLGDAPRPANSALWRGAALRWDKPSGGGNSPAIRTLLPASCKGLASRPRLELGWPSGPRMQLPISLPAFHRSYRSKQTAPRCGLQGHHNQSQVDHLTIKATGHLFAILNAAIGDQLDESCRLGNALQVEGCSKAVSIASTISSSESRYSELRKLTWSPTFASILSPRNLGKATVP